MSPAPDHTSPPIPPFMDLGEVTELPEVIWADVRWYIGGRDGREVYLRGHVPGAVHVDLDRLAASPDEGRGRHPLPTPEDLAAYLSSLGISGAVPVVAYDDMGGVAAARLVWMLRALGVDAALLNGGLDAWDGPLEEGETVIEPATFEVRPWPAERLADITEVEELSRAISTGSDPGITIVDVRAPGRYRGEEEVIDPRAGHIPGAINIPVASKLGRDRRVPSPDTLVAHYREHGVDRADRTVVSCGSGVTACHDLLAMEYAGLGLGRLYPGSWSEWCSDPTRPVATDTTI